MMPFLILLATVPTGHLPACGGYDLHPDATATAAIARLVTRDAHKATGPMAIDRAMGIGAWRIIWATPADSEPGVFVFKGIGAKATLRDVWGGPTSDRAGAARWAAALGMPAALAQCFAARLVDVGP